MGKKNPIKQIASAVVDTIHIPEREIARGVGLQGVSDAFDTQRLTEKKHINETLDFATGSAKKKKEEAREGTRRDEANAAAAAGEENKRLGLAETARIEEERMGTGSRSRTLLTGPAGLEDEAGGMSRRTLQGRRRA